jgi:hypothetical protein
MNITVVRIGNKLYSNSIPQSNDEIRIENSWEDQRVFNYFYCCKRVFELSEGFTVIKLYENPTDFMRNVLELKWRIKYMFNDTVKVVYINKIVLIYSFDSNGNSVLTLDKVRTYKNEVNIDDIIEEYFD